MTCGGENLPIKNIIFPEARHEKAEPPTTSNSFFERLNCFSKEFKPSIRIWFATEKNKRLAMTLNVAAFRGPVERIATWRYSSAGEIRRCT